VIEIGSMHQRGKGLIVVENIGKAVIDRQEDPEHQEIDRSEPGKALHIGERNPDFSPRFAAGLEAFAAHARRSVDSGRLHCSKPF
jgi:hypothetical protein